MNILITGGAGFIGRGLIRALHKEHSVTILDSFCNCNKKEFITFIKKNGINNAEIIDGEIKSSLSKINSADCVIHFAENTNVQDAIDHPQEIFDQNLASSLLLLEWCRRHKAHFIYPSTAMVYDAPDFPGLLSEQSRIKPANPYAACKFAVEQIALSYYYAYGLPVTILRLFNPYGPYQRAAEGAVSNMLARKKNHERIIIYGDGSQKRDFLFVDDAADAISKVIKNNKAHGQIFNIGYGKDISIKDLALLIGGSDDKVEFREHLHPKSEIKRLVCDNTKARNILKWYPKIDVKEGIKQFDRFLAENI